MVTIKDMAEMAGVAPTTVSNVLHGRTKKMSKETLARVQKVIDECQYVTNMGARLLANYGSRIIGVIISYGRREEQNAIQDPFFSEVIGALEKEIRLNGYFMMLYTSGNVEESLKIASSWNIEGLVVLGCQPEDCSKFKQSSKIPVVFIDSYFVGDERQFENVGLQDYEGGRLVAEYLVKQGHRRIAFLADAEIPVGVDRRRLEGCKTAVLEAGGTWTDENYIALSYQEDVRHRFLEEFCGENLRNYTALVFASDFYAIDAINVFFRQGVQVPDDVSVTGFDDNVFAKQSRPRLTTVHQNPSRKAGLAIGMLLRMLRGETIEEPNIRLPVSIIARESVKKIK